MCIHICLARSLHEKSHVNVYLQTRLMIYVLVQCSILCSFKISIHINVCYKHVIGTYVYVHLVIEELCIKLFTRKYYLAMLINWACACTWRINPLILSMFIEIWLYINACYLCICIHICLTRSLTLTNNKV